MKDKEKKDTFCDNAPACPVPSRPSLFKTLETVREQVDYEGFGTPRPNGHVHIDALYNELCLIIAEMYVKPPAAVVRIRGEEMEAGIVQEVYRELDHSHIELVADNFRQQTTLIRKKTAYLQTSLYNVLFELDAHYTNLVKHDVGY